ncbi:hypothetical protein AJ87_26630 [Rhizobium yanglingense]|nr:hypothetical protein AJ87_26630 [Rhizobium yanglingense]
MIRLNRALFPQRSDDFVSVTRVPVMYSPLLGSPESFVIGAVCYDGRGIHLERANSLSRLECFYGQQSIGAIVAIEFALDDLSEAIKSADFSLGRYRPSVSGLAFGEEERVEGRSLQEVSSSWMTAMSSLYRRTELDIIQLPVSDVSPVAPRKNSETENLKQLFDYTVQRQPSLMAAFNRDLFSARRRRANSPQTVFIDFSGTRLVANFGILTPRHYSAAIDRIKRQMWDLKIARDQDRDGPAPREHEMIVQHPESSSFVLDRRRRRFLTVSGVGGPGRSPGNPISANDLIRRRRKPLVGQRGGVGLPLASSTSSKAFASQGDARVVLPL